MYQSAVLCPLQERSAVSDSLGPHGLQPLQAPLSMGFSRQEDCRVREKKVKVTQPCLTPRSCGPYSPWDFPGQNTGVGSLSLLQGNLPDPGIKPRSPALQADFLPAESGKPRTLEWVAYPFCSRSSRPRNRTKVPCTAGSFFTH